jgi:NAD(P)-dependent dehydrogenase (short-subunit alcohol dehydrogenase family)
MGFNGWLLATRFSFEVRVMANRIALITGAGSGIGRAVAVKLQSSGYDVVLCGRRLVELEKTVAMAGAGQSLCISTDVTDEAAVVKAFAQARERFGRLDVLFNNAGIFSVGQPIDQISAEAWRQSVDVNLTGAFFCAREAFRIMKAQSPQGGRIINNGSISGHVPRPQSVPYTSTKHAITGLTKAISLDGRGHKIACSQIDIGNTATDFTDKMAKGILQADGSLKVEPRFDVAHVADAVLYMANLPLEANVQFMTLLATEMPYIGRG